MAAPPLYYRGKMAGRHRFRPLIFVGVVVILLVAFSVGYKQGTNSQYRRRLAEQNAAEMAAKKANNECQTQKQAIMYSRARGNTQMEGEIAHLRDLQNKLLMAEEENAELFKQNAACEAEASSYEVRIQAQTEEDAFLRAEVESLRQSVDQLRAKMLTVSGGEGFSGMLERRALEVLRKRYIAQCSSVPRCVVLTNEELLEAFGQNVSSVSKAREALEMNEKAQMFLMPHPLLPNASNIADVYFPPSGKADDFDRPVSAGYTECPHNDTDIERGQTASLSQRLSMLEDLMLCAYRHAENNFTFPSFFRHQGLMGPGGPGGPAYLHELFTTPFVKFSRWCDDELREAVRLACYDDRMRDHYGGHDFWAARSRLLPVQSIDEEVHRFYDARELVGKPTLAVVLRRPRPNECSSHFRRSREQHYLYLKRAFPNDPALANHSSDHASQQCAPTAQEVVQLIQNIDTNASSPYSAIILSMPVDMLNDVKLVLEEKASDLLQRIETYETPAGTSSARAELVELEIASRATAIVVSPYLTPSRYVTERFLLRNGLDPHGRVFFVN